MGKYSTPIKKFVERIAEHTHPTKILAGYKWSPVPIEHVQGQCDLPMLCFLLPKISEKRKAVVITDGTLILRLGLSVERAHGPEKWMQQLETVLDALEYDAATPAVKDLSLGGALINPFSYEVRDAWETDTTVNFEIEITLRPNFTGRGDRRT